MKNKEGQLAIFVILGIILVSAIVFFFIYVQPNISTSSGELNVERCVRESIEKNSVELGLTGGVENPTFVYSYLDENYTFLCYTDEYYKPCVVQQPFILSNFQEKLNKLTGAEIEQCYKNSIQDLRAKGYEVIEGNFDTNVLIQPGVIEVEINTPTTIRTPDAARTINTGVIKIRSDLSLVLNVATSILQFETSYGDVETQTLMLYYPNLLINKIRRGDEVKIYTIKNQEGNEEFRFASRSYAWPPGYGI